MGKKSINSHIKKIIADKTCNPKDSFKTYNEIGSGEYGKVFKACINDKCENKVAVKNSTENMSSEFFVSKKLDKLGVPYVYGYEKCSNRDFLFSEFVNGVTLRHFLEKRKQKTTNEELKSIIIQVLYILYTINKKYPSFRHNDLHLDNIMILRKRKDAKREITVGEKTIEFDEAKVEVKIMDFGLATMKGVVNPIVKNSETFKRDYGIFPESHPAYDLHLFLASLYVSKIDTSVKKLIESLFKPEYLKKSSDVVNEFRLRSNKKHDLPMYSEIFKNPYFSKPKNSVKNFINKLPAPVKLKTPPKKTTTPVNQEKAKQKAILILKQMNNKKKIPPKAPVKRPSLMKPPTKPLFIRGSPK